MKKNLSFLVVMLTFFTMGFVDLVGAASNHVQLDLGLTESQTYFIPSLVFFWFLIFSVPTSALMNKIGRKNTVLVSLAITLLSLILPIFGNGYWLMLIAFSLLGIGNAIMQTSLKVFDINLRQHWYNREVVETSLQKSNILKINDEEILVVKSLLELQGTTYGELCLELIRRYDLQMVILTCGTEGSYVFSEQEESFLPTPKVQVADTVGAGDSFTGAFVALLLQGKSIREAHQMAVKVSAFVCTQAGAMPRYSEMGALT